MKILHVVESLANSGGGLPASVKSLMALQKNSGHVIDCAETKFNDNPAISSIYSVTPLGRSISRLFSLCTTVARRKYDIVHIHGLWDIFYPAICFACFIGRTNYFVTTHGQLLSTILQADSALKRLKKNIYLSCIGRLILRGSKRIHVSSENELREFKNNSVLTKKTYFIPHIIDSMFFKDPAILPNQLVEESGQFKDILFVGRLDRRKGVLDLIDGFVHADLPLNWRLRIVGPVGEPEFMKEMHGKIAEYAHPERIIIDGPVYGEMRRNLYLSCYLFCLPSYSEAPGLVNIEAALLGRPVLTTPNTGLYMLRDEGGMLCETGCTAISDALASVNRWSAAEYCERSRRIQSWAIRDYSITAILPKWDRFYSS